MRCCGRFSHMPHVVQIQGIFRDGVGCQILCFSCTIWYDEVLTLVDLDLTYLLGLLAIFLIGDAIW